MTSEAAIAREARHPLARFWHGSTGPVLIIIAAILLIWYAAAVWLNAPMIRSAAPEIAGADLIRASWQADRPLLPAPHQVLAELWRTVIETTITSKRSLVYHSWITVSSALVGFAIGALLGILLAVAIVHVRSLEKSLLPWIICSQMVPILAIAPIVIVVFGAIGIRGLFPKSIISAYLCFFPVTIGMVKGLTSPDPIQLDLMRTWSASKLQVFSKLRWPSSIPFLFASLKVSVTISLVGAIVAELPTGAQAGIGARLLTGSYYGQTVQIWAALVAAAIISTVLIAIIDAVGRLVAWRMGASA